MKLRFNLMQRRWIRYARWCERRGEKPIWGCHILPETFMPRMKLCHK